MKLLDALEWLAKPSVSSSGLSPFPNEVGPPLEGVSLIPTRPTFSSGGSRGVAMAHSSMRRSKLVATRGLLPCSEASWRTYENSIKPQAPQHLLPPARRALGTPCLCSQACRTSRTQQELGSITPPSSSHAK